MFVDDECRVIMQHEINDLYMDNLAVLHAKLQYARQLETEGTKLPKDLTSCLERLRLAVCHIQI
jgi:hypothetical protein